LKLNRKPFKPGLFRKLGMKKVFLFICAGCFSFCGFTQTKPEEINEVLKAYTKQNSFNGTVLVAQHGVVLLEKGYGFKNMQTNALNDSNTIYQIGSLTKQFTAIIILQLQEQLRLSVSDPLIKYIPDYPGGDKITIENLLTHTSGIVNYTKDELFMNNNAVNPITIENLIAQFKNKPLEFTPGEKYSYSNSGYILLGYIIQKITGKSYFEVVRENIFQPLGMNHSGFDFKALKNRDKATGYLRLSRKINKPAPIVDSTISFSAGGIYTTVGDLYKWDRALYSEKIVSSASLEKAFTPYRANYGYGWVIDTTYGKKVLMHEGGIFGFVSFIGRIPVDEICIILLDNRGSEGLPKIGENINAILNDQPYDFPKERKEIEVDSSILKKYIGDYQLAPSFIITISFESGELFAQATGQEKTMLFAEREDFFFLKLTDVQIEFIKSPEGKTERLNLYQGGQKLPAIKIK
jgi:CubicO group peptidase (beta-lactamase class C family)